MESPQPAPPWTTLAKAHIDQGRYAEAAALYQQAIEQQPEVVAYYWTLGLLQLLQGQEVEAQMTWMVPLMDGDEAALAQRTRSLVLLLDEAASVRHSQDAKMAWVLRQHIYELDPHSLNNVLLLVQLSAQLDLLSQEDWDGYRLEEQIRARSQVEPTLLRKTIAALLGPPAHVEKALSLLTAALPHIEADPDAFVKLLVEQANRIGYREGRPKQAARLLELARQLAPKHLLLLRLLSLFYQNSGAYTKALAIAEAGFNASDTLVEQVIASHVLLRALMTVCRQWRDIDEAFERHIGLLKDLVQAYSNQNLPPIPPAENRWLFTAPFFQPYLRDELAANRQLQNQVAAIAQDNTRSYYHAQSARYQFLPRQAQPLKIGYVSASLRRHSVGWLARALFQHRDRERFQVHNYMVNYYSRPDALRDWYADQSDVAHQLDAHSPNIADRIYDDGIDILVDLDSLTLDTTCEVMALRPAPIQVSWLGWDASGIPAIDYYIVDPYVLPEGAQAAYAERLVRLPRTYIAVDGFEQNVPSLTRRDLDISEDAVVYLSTQRSYKRHPQMIRLQMQILRAVPGSYFIIKAMTISDSLKQIFLQIAEDEGVCGDRLRFLTGVPEEATHRANLAIADVVLDTYPYNGATTTMEVLWMGIPLVTRVGETFSSRNSYTMMRNAGISEGIAWSDEEYIDWGTRLGQDLDLRRQIAWKLWQGRRSAPLWNGRQFTQDMEQAYSQMWERYISST